MKKLTVLLAMFVLCAGLAGCNGSSDSENTVAFVTNGIDPFWDIAEKGAQDAAKEEGVKLQVKMPPEGAADQQRMVEELLTLGVAGVAISPIDPDHQTDMLKAIAERSKLITHDSDAPKSDRLCYVGMDNYAAGRMCGELVKKAMPEGGEVMIFIGRLGQANANLRRQGVIDELLNRTHDKTRNDPQSGVLTSPDSKYTVLDTRTDNFDLAQAKSKAEDAIAKYENLGAMVGLFAYNPPILLETVKNAGKLGKIQVVAFDEDRRTLQAIVDGEMKGTVVQSPYQYGYQSVKILASLARGDESVIPEGGFVEIKARTITKENVDEFWTELKGLLGEGTQTEEGEAVAGEEEAESEEDAVETK